MSFRKHISSLAPRCFGALAALASFGTALHGCGTAPQLASDVSNIPYPGGDGPQWVYNGPLPALEDAEVIVSLKGHTARVTGFLPASFSGTIPYYAVLDSAGTRRRITVVYPIATGNLSSFNDNGTAVRNAPGTYSAATIYPRKTLNSIAEWGGFPFIVYNTSRAIGFHGPITHDSKEWFLKRGPVSHGCNRMQGEHVVEMAHLLGVDMRGKIYSSGDSRKRTFKTRVLDTSAGFDVFEGKNVDVDYPTSSGATRPSSNVRVFPTWDARELRRSVCRYNASRSLGERHCDSQPANKIDITTGGRTVGVIECPAGYALESVGSQGGRICTDGVNVWGPFTKAMVAKCLSWGGGDAPCNSDRWGRSVALSARGTALCPEGASFDTGTGYCTEGLNAFGPFPASLIAKCEAAGGGETACRSARWNRDFLKNLL
jgi:hypothetical protein